MPRRPDSCAARGYDGTRSHLGWMSRSRQISAAARQAGKKTGQRTNVYVEIATACQFSVSDTLTYRNKTRLKAEPAGLGLDDPLLARPKHHERFQSRPLVRLQTQCRQKTDQKSGPPRAHTTEARQRC